MTNIKLCEIMKTWELKNVEVREKHDVLEEYLIERYNESKRNLLKATERLKEALQEKENDIVIDGTLYRFEFTFELAWKTMKDYLEYSGIIDWDWKSKRDNKDSI